MAASSVKLLVLSNPASPELELLKRLPQGTEVVGIGKTLPEFEHLTAEQWSSINAVLSCGVGANAATREFFQQDLWPKLTNLTWLHTSSAGLEHLLFPELIASSVKLTNAKGVYSHSLAEYALLCCNYFAKDLPRILRQQKESKWEQFCVEELRGKTFGVIGYGDIGQACARLARAHRMRVVALRRRTDLTAAEVQEGTVEKLYSPEQLNELMAACEYVVMATPWTPETNKMVSKAAIAAMKPNGVFINVGRGKCVDEEALIEALKEGRIRGAGLDVFATEPLPADSPLWSLGNVFMTPHCADRTKEFQFESLTLFLENVQRFLSSGHSGLQNVVDKSLGY